MADREVYLSGAAELASIVNKRRNHHNDFGDLIRSRMGLAGMPLAGHGPPSALPIPEYIKQIGRVVSFERYRPDIVLYSNVKNIASLDRPGIQ